MSRRRSERRPRSWSAGTQAITAAFATPPARSKLQTIGIEPLGSTTAAFGAFMFAESEKYGAAIKQNGAKAE